MLLRHAIGSVLRRRRLARGQTLRELAEQSRVSLPYLSEIERGRKEASSEILGTLCRVLDLSEQQLLAEVGEEFAAQGASSVALTMVGQRETVSVSVAAGQTSTAEVHATASLHATDSRHEIAAVHQSASVYEIAGAHEKARLHEVAGLHDPMRVLLAA